MHLQMRKTVKLHTTNLKRAADKIFLFPPEYEYFTLEQNKLVKAHLYELDEIQSINYTSIQN